MSLWQFAACVDGYNKANSPDDEMEPLSPEEFDDMLARHADWVSGGGAVH